MDQYVLEIGAADFGPLKEILSRELAGLGLTTQVLDLGDSAALTYRHGPESLSDALTLIDRGLAVSVAAHPSGGSLRYALVLPPRFNGQQLSLWSATLEWTDRRWQETWRRLLIRSDLRFVAVGFEEGVEVSDDLLSPERFPWTAWPTVIAALRTDAGWVVRSNPSFSASSPVAEVT